MINTLTEGKEHPHLGRLVATDSELLTGGNTLPATKGVVLRILIQRVRGVDKGAAEEAARARTIYLP